MQNGKGWSFTAISVGVALGLFSDICLWNRAYGAETQDRSQPAAQTKNIFNLIKRLRQNYDAGAPPVTDTYTSEILPAGTATLSTQNVDSRFAEGEDIIFDVTLQGYKLSELYAVKSAGGYQIGLANLLEILDLPINFSLEQRSADGWFLSEDNLFQLTVSEGAGSYAVVGKNRFDLTPDQYEIGSDDIYIELSQISKWFGLTSMVNEEYLKLELTSEHKLPVIARFERQNTRQVVAAYGSKSVLPATGVSYTSYSAPLVDVQLGVSHTSVSDVGSYSVSSNQDLAYFNSEVFVYGNTEDSLQAVRLNLSKESAEGDLLPLLPVTRLELGDVTPFSIGSGASAGLSRGFSISNTPLNQLYDNKRVTIAGQMPVGWDVEVYRGGVLLNRALAVNEGRYEFRDIELYYGKNEFEIVLYGPQGQVETRNESYVIDQNEVLAGQSFYNLSMVELNRSVFDSLFEEPPPDTGLLSSFIFNQGITDWLAFRAGFSTYDSDIEGRQDSLVAGVNLNIAGEALLNSSLRIDREKRRVVESGLRTELAGIDWNLNYSKAQEDDDALQNRNQERYGLNFSGDLFGRLNYANTFSQDTFGDGNRTTTISNALGISSPFGAISNSLIYQKTENPSALDKLREELAKELSPFDEVESEEQLLLDNPLLVSERYSTRGVLSYTRRFGSVLTRLSGAYQIQPDSEILSYGANFNMPLSQSLTTDLRFSYFPQFDRRQYGMGLSWRYNDFIFNAFGNYTDSDSYQIGLSTRFSFGAATKAENYAFSGKQVGPYGGAIVKVYEDKNLNQRHDEGEPLIKNARVQAVQANTEATTGAEGYAVLSGIVPNTKTDIVIDRISLEDDRMVSTIPGFSITSRKGYWEPLELPVSRTAEIEGKVYFYDENEVQQPATYVGVHLINKVGQTVNSTQTEYDGYYLFTDVLPGFYRVEIDKRSSRRKSLRDAEPLVFAVRGGVDILDGTTIVMQQAQLEPGYAVTMGGFNSLMLLKTYWSLLAKTGMNVAKLRPFYIQNDGKHNLYAGFYKDQTTADELCNRLAKRGFSCSVREFEFKL